ncbi:MAG: restriction endonuclease subunit S [Treponema sp.]|nr:restriction endonuclease subunit S [Treponema sp.]
MSQWKKVKIGDICKIVKGTTGIASAEPGQYPLVVTAEERKTCSSYQFDCEAVCIPLVSSSGHGKKSLKNVHYQNGKFALGTILCAVIPNNPDELDARFLHQYLQFYKDTVLVPLMKGAANVSLSMKDIATVEFPLPPIEKQRELSNLFITLQEKQKELTAETEQQLEYTKLLRQNILQDAIEGKLTVEWRKSHPVIKGNPDYDAEALFEKIQKGEVSPSLQPDKPSSATPSAGSNAARNARSKKMSPITAEEKPFEIPEGWIFTRLGEISEIVRGGSPRPAGDKTYYDGDIPFLKVADLTGSNEKELYQFTYTIKEAGLKKTRLVEKETLMLTNSGATLGIPKICMIQTTFNDGIAAFLGIYERILKDYLYYFLKSKTKWFLKEAAKGQGQPNLNTDIVSGTILPLPPLKEQEEIVNKIESLLAKVTELENQIQERKTLSEKLAFGIIKEKLEG